MPRKLELLKGIINFIMIDLDATDLRLLDLLQTDASLSNQDLAARAHTSPATALRRVRRLVERGVIERRVALLSPAALGEALNAIIEITLDRQGAEHLEAFEQRAVNDAAVQQCWRVAPGPDFVLVAAWPTWRATRRWCSACSPRTPMCAT